jgi:U3 small nucleolar RNA-associated protein 15
MFIRVGCSFQVDQAREHVQFLTAMDEGWNDRGGAGDYKKVQIIRPPRNPETLTQEQRYWKQFKPVSVTQAYSAVYCVAFCRAAPYDFAASNSTRIQIYNRQGKNVKRTVSRFKDVVYSASFRSDGKLLVASGEETDVKVFDLASRDLLRLLKGHKRAVHTCKFSDDRIHVVSGGDDSLLKFWDVPSGEAVLTMEGHTDYIRSLTPSPASQEV